MSDAAAIDAEAIDEADPGDEAGAEPARTDPPPTKDRGKTVHGEAANAGHRVLAPDDAEVEAYLETALKAPAPDARRDDRPSAPSRPSPTPSSSSTSAASSPS